MASVQTSNFATSNERRIQKSIGYYSNNGPSSITLIALGFGKRCWASWCPHTLGHMLITVCRSLERCSEGQCAIAAVRSIPTSGTSSCSAPTPALKSLPQPAEGGLYAAACLTWLPALTVQGDPNSITVWSSKPLDVPTCGTMNSLRPDPSYIYKSRLQPVK